MRIKVQLLFLFLFALLVGAAPAGAAEYTVGQTSGARGRYVFRLRVRHFPRFPYFLGYSRPANVFVR